MTADLNSMLQQQLGVSSVEEAVAQLTKDDPQLASLAQLLTQREEELEAQIAREEDADADPDHLDLTDQERSRRRELARDRLRRLGDELERAAGIVADLASALGACASCAGSDPACRLCRGQGRPGSLPPDPGDFERIVMPAVRAHAFTRARTRRVSDAGAAGNHTTEERNAHERVR
jgi:hypothetical protein